MTSDGLEFSIHVRPGTSRSSVDGAFDGVLAVRVTAAALGGDANRAVCRLLADAFDLRPNSVEIVRGSRSRRKRVRVLGDRVRLAIRHQELLTGGHP